MRLHPARAQATLELALILPFIVGLLAISLQGGLVISDQVNLEHSAYDASLWLTSNLSNATVGNTTGCGTVAPAGTIVRHICDQLCGPGGKAGVPTPSYTRYCDSSLRVTTTTTTPQALWTPPPPLSPIRDVMAAGPSPSPSPACQNWALKLAPASATVTAGDPTLGTATYTVAFKGTPSGKGASPIVTLAASGFPTPPANSLTFTHKVIQYDTSQGGFSSTMMTVTTAPNTLAGPYVIEVTGSDQCGGHGSASSDKAVDLTVKPGVYVSAAPAPKVRIASVLPNLICAGQPTTITITGDGLASGLTVVTVGGVLATVTTATNSQIVAVVTLVNSGWQTVTVTSGTDQGTLVQAIYLSGSCTGSPSVAPSAGTSACATSAGPFEIVITISWQEQTLIPLLGSPSVNLKATQHVFCQ